MTGSSEKKIANNSPKINPYEAMRIYFDGGCRPNPGQMDVAIVLEPIRGNMEPMTALRIGHGTNNIAEWSSVVWAAEVARSKNIKSFTLVGDSMLVVNQINGIYKVSDKFKPFYDRFMEITRDMEVNVIHVYRHKNWAGFQLEY